MLEHNVRGQREQRGWGQGESLSHDTLLPRTGPVSEVERGPMWETWDQQWTKAAGAPQEQRRSDNRPGATDPCRHPFWTLKPEVLPCSCLHRSNKLDGCPILTSLCADPVPASSSAIRPNHLSRGKSNSHGERETEPRCEH